MGRSDTSEQRAIPRLMSPAALVLLGLGVVTLLLLLLPDRDDFERRISAQAPDQLSLIYLQLAVQESPGDASLRLLLARQYYEMTRYDDALRTLAPLLDEDSRAGHEARLLRIETLHAHCTGRAGAARSRPAPCSPAVIDEIWSAMVRNDAMARAELERLAEIGMANGAPGLAGSLYEERAGRTPGPDLDAGHAAMHEAIPQTTIDEQVAWLEQAAHAYLAGEQPEHAAAMHARIAALVPAATAEQHIELALANLESANRPQDALALALDRLQRAPDSPRLLRSAIGLALASDRPALAAELGRRLVALYPDVPSVIASQIELELAVGHIDRALPLAERLVQLTPGDRRAHEHLARIADWSGLPLLALPHWTWLARNHHDARHHARALALAQATWDQELVLALTLDAAARRPPDRARQLAIADLYLRLGRPEEARAVVARVTAAHPGHRPAWDMLRAIHHATVDLHAEADTWAHIHQHFGTTEAEARAWADVLWRAHRRDEAMAVLARGTGPDAPDLDTLRMQAELAWQTEQLERARDAYGTLWQRRLAREDEVERLILLARETGQVTLALDVAEQQWYEQRQPRILLLAMQIAADSERWDDLGRLEAMAESTPRPLDGMAAYWRLRMARRQQTLRATLKRQDHDSAQAVLRELAGELRQASRSSRELTRDHAYRDLWADLHRQQIYVALMREDFQTLERVLDEARELEGSFDYWRLRIMLRHRRLREALDAGQLDRAARLLAEMEGYLARAAQRGGANHPDYPAVHADLQQQKLYLAVARGDLATARHLLAITDIPPVDRVRILARLERHEEAAHLAIHARRDARERAEQHALDTEIETLTRRLARQASGHTRVLDLQGLRIWEVGTSVRHTGNTLGVGATMVGRRLEPMSDPAGTDPARTHEAVLRLFAQWRTTHGATELGLGAQARARALLPQLDLAHNRHLTPGIVARVDSGMSQLVDESGALRLRAVRDHATVQVNATSVAGLRGGARLGGQLYRDHERSRLGTGIDAQVHVGHGAQHRGHDWNLRLVGSTARRFHLDPALAPDLPARSHMVAVATGLARGEPGRVATPVGRVRYGIDVTGGMLMPEQRLAYSVTAGVGVPVLGADELSLALELANTQTLTATPLPDGGRWGAVLQYARSIW